MAEGYIKLYRKSMESTVFQNSNLWHVWCYCLMRANHKRTEILWNKREVILKSGQFITGRFHGAKDCRMNPNTFYLQMKTLESLGNIIISSNNKNSIVTIVKWASYQGQDKIDNNKITAKQQQNNTDKNVKNDKKYSNDDFEKLWLVFPNSELGNKGSKKQALSEFLKLRPDKISMDLLIDAAKKQAEYKKMLKERGEFVPQFPHVVRWLKDERWTDEIPQEKITSSFQPVRIYGQN